MTNERVLVVGAGNFGTCLADHLADQGRDVTMWARDPSLVASINKQHINSKYMPNTKLSPSLKATTELDPQTVSGSTVIIMSIPTQHMRPVLQQIKAQLTQDHLLVFVNKGIEVSTLALPNQIVDEVCGPAISRGAVFLSGPSFAAEVVSRQPTAVSVASSLHANALRTQMLFHAPHFRVYEINDVVGVEVAGALKNVIAVACGACAGIGFRSNARAALITRGLAEITRFGVTLGADPLTFVGLSGVGDLLLTCSSEQSRNFTVGFRIGRGEALQDIVVSLGSVAEGLATAKAAFHLARSRNVDSPITDQVFAVLYQDKPIRDAMKDLMERDPSHELRGIH